MRKSTALGDILEEMDFLEKENEEYFKTLLIVADFIVDQNLKRQFLEYVLDRTDRYYDDKDDTYIGVEMYDELVTFLNKNDEY